MVMLKDQEPNDAKAAAMIRAIDNTGIRMFMYFPQSKMISVPEKTCAAYQCKSVYEDMPGSFAEDFVLAEDYEAFSGMYEEIDRGAKTATAIFHSKDMKYCHHVTLTTVSWTEDGQPLEAFGLIEDMSDLYRYEQIAKRLQKDLTISSMADEGEDALKTIASAIGSQYYAVYYIWLQNQSYLCYREQLKGILSVIGEKGNYTVAWNQYIENYIEPVDQGRMKEFADITTLAERIGDKNSITHIYRRKEVGWTRGQFIVGKRDAEGKVLTVIYTVSDINEEVETKLERDAAEQETLHDSMTGVWNRKAFEQYRNAHEYRNKPIGLMLFDIDRFKGINDQYGHEMGDRAINVVVEQVRNVLRQEDMLFRIGGDEFAVLLYNYKESYWSSLCRKIEQLHMDVKENLPPEMSVTISAGICISESGYQDSIFHMADTALYHTKSSGRGGCTMINMNEEVLKEWHDANIGLRRGDILEHNSTVTWRIEIPKEAGKPIRAYGDRLLRTFLGIDEKASPENIYHAWEERVLPDYFDIIIEAFKAAIACGKAEVVYLWNHPDQGVMQLRCSASLEGENDELYSLIGYIHVNTGTHVYTLEDVSNSIRNALEEMYFCNIYFRLNDYTFKVYKAMPYLVKLVGDSENAEIPIRLYVEKVVAEDCKAKMADFLNLRTLKDRMRGKNVIECDYFDPNIGWSRARFVAVNRDENGELETATLVVEAKA